MCRYGCIEVLITDQGGEFVNKISFQLYAIIKTEHRITSAYHLQVHTVIHIPVVVILIISQPCPQVHFQLFHVCYMCSMQHQ